MDPKCQRTTSSVKKRFLNRYYSSIETHENFPKDRKRNFQYGTNADNKMYENTSQKKKMRNMHKDCLMMDQSGTSQKDHILRYKKVQQNTTQIEKHVLQMNSSEVKPHTSIEKKFILQSYLMDENKSHNSSIQLKYESRPGCSRAECEDEQEFKEVHDMDQSSVSHNPLENEDDEEELSGLFVKVPPLLSPLPQSPEPDDELLLASEPIQLKPVLPSKAPLSNNLSTSKLLVKPSQLEQNSMLKSETKYVGSSKAWLKTSHLSNSSAHPIFEKRQLPVGISPAPPSVELPLVKSLVPDKLPPVIPPAQLPHPPFVKTPLPSSSVPPLGVENTTRSKEFQQLSEALKSELFQVTQPSCVSFQQAQNSLSLGSGNRNQQNKNVYIFESTIFLNDDRNAYVTFCYNLKKGFEPYVLIGNMHKSLPLPMTVFKIALPAITDIGNGYSDNKYYAFKNGLYIKHLSDANYIIISYNDDKILLHQDEYKNIVKYIQYFNIQIEKYIFSSINAIQSFTDCVKNNCMFPVVPQVSFIDYSL